MLDHNVVPLFVLQACMVHYNWISVSTTEVAQQAGQHRQIIQGIQSTKIRITPIEPKMGTW